MVLDGRGNFYGNQSTDEFEQVTDLDYESIGLTKGSRLAYMEALNDVKIVSNTTLKFNATIEYENFFEVPGMFMDFVDQQIKNSSERLIGDYTAEF